MSLSKLDDKKLRLNKEMNWISDAFAAGVKNKDVKASPVLKSVVLVT